MLKNKTYTHKKCQIVHCKKNKKAQFLILYWEDSRMEENLRYVMVGRGAIGFLPLKPIIQYNYEMSKSSKKHGLILPLPPPFIQRANFTITFNCGQLPSIRFFKVCVSSALLQLNVIFNLFTKNHGMPKSWHCS